MLETMINKEGIDIILKNYKLLNRLRKYGKVHVTEDNEKNSIKIYVQNDNVTREHVYRLTNEIIEVFRPIKYEGKEENIQGKKCYLVNFMTEVVEDSIWNIDIWIS